MQSNLKIWAVGLTFLISGSGAIAKSPAHGGGGKNAVVAATTADAEVGCAVLVPIAINPNLDYTVKVVRVPSYPGGWFHPTIIIDATYPTAQGSEIVDSREQTIATMGVTYATATFTVPDASVIQLGGTANIDATVREPMNNGKFKETTCTATTMVY